MNVVGNSQKKLQFVRVILTNSQISSLQKVTIKLKMKNLPVLLFASITLQSWRRKAHLSSDFFPIPNLTQTLG